MNRGTLGRVRIAQCAAVLLGSLFLTQAAGGGLSALPSIPAGGWKVVPSPALAGGELIAVSALNQNEAWAVGSRAPGGGFYPLAEHWDGAQWKNVDISGPGGFNQLRAVADVSTSNAWAVGVTGSWSALIEHWNGSSWTPVSSPVSGAQTPLYGLKAFAANDIWAVGENGSNGLALHFDGTSWSNVPLPEPPGDSLTVFTQVDGTSASDVWVVGQSGDGPAQPLVEHFDGSTWTIVPSPPSAGDYAYVRGLDVRPGGNLWLVGDTLGPPPDYTESPLVQHRDANGWTTLDSTGNAEPWGVAALSDTDAWIVGNRFDGSSDYVATIEHWNGTSWRMVPMIQTLGGDSALNGVDALPGGTVWAVGSYSPRGFDQPLIELNAAG
jgi:hypothetical protein